MIFTTHQLVKKMTNKMTKDKYYMPYFLHSELACKGSGKIFLAEGFKEQLLILRQQFNQPMIVTSCCRSFEYNAKIGGAKNSFHIYDHPTRKPAGTAAIDISITECTTRGKLINLAWSLGWRRTACRCRRARSISIRRGDRRRRIRK